MYQNAWTVITDIGCIGIRYVNIYLQTFGYNFKWSWVKRFLFLLSTILTSACIMWIHNAEKIWSWNFIAVEPGCPTLCFEPHWLISTIWVAHFRFWSIHALSCLEFHSCVLVWTYSTLAHLLFCNFWVENTMKLRTIKFFGIGNSTFKTIYSCYLHLM